MRRELNFVAARWDEPGGQWRGTPHAGSIA
jgi:hypothetical protein